MADSAVNAGDLPSDRIRLRHGTMLTDADGIAVRRGRQVARASMCARVERFRNSVRPLANTVTAFVTRVRSQSVLARQRAEGHGFWKVFPASMNSA
jgi:hypothetical protein